MSIVPRNRLIIAASAVFVPSAALAAAAPQYAGLGMLACAAVLILAVSDALLSRRRLDGIQVDLPAVLRSAVGRRADLQVRITTTAGAPGKIALGLALPADAVSAVAQVQVDLSGGRSRNAVPWKFQALRRGRWPLQRAYLEADSRFGFWGVRRRRPLTSEIRIYPALDRQRGLLSAMFANRGTGAHAQRQVGKGREFEQLRDYLPGDSIEDIHWKASARRGSPITKVYQIERTQRIYVALDMSRLSRRRLADMPGGPPAATEESAVPAASILERFMAAALALAMAAERQGDHFGLICFDDRIRSFLPAKGGKGHYSACRDAVGQLEAGLVSPDFKEVFTFIGSRLRRRALLVFLTSLDDPVLAESFSDGIDLVSRRHVILVNTLRIDGIAPLFEGQPPADLDGVYARLGGHLLWRRIVDIQKMLHRRGVRLSLLEHAKLCPELIAQYTALKRRQVL